MFETKTDEAWEYFGKNDPYFGVLTSADFKKGQLTEEAKKHFFATGELYVESLFEAIQEVFEPDFRPARAMDFGCGVGRLIIPFAARCGAVVGVDVSTSMLDTARRNCRELGLTNASFVQADDRLSYLAGDFDFIHSFIVFQHIPQGRGLEIFRRQVGMLKGDGIGAIHFTYSYGGRLPAWRRLQIAAQHRVPLVNGLTNLVKGRPAGEPPMQMNEYDVNRLLKILQESGCHQVHLRFSETSDRGRPFYGVTFLFRKRQLDVRAHA
jgi:SAM-dependent methyltransferase